MRRLLAVLLLPLTLLLGSCAHWPAGPREVADVQTHAVLLQKIFAAVMPDGNLKLMGTGATGVVVGTDGKYDVVLTAAHVCRVPASVKVKVRLRDGSVAEINAPTVMPLQRAVSRDGKKFPLEVLRMSDKADLCLARYEGHAAVPARLGSSMPGVGEWVLMAGAPSLIWHPDHGTVLVVDGRYIGLVVENPPDEEKYLYAMYSIPVTGGASGSGVYYDGLLVGILSAGDTEYEHCAYASTLGQIREFLKGK